MVGASRKGVEFHASVPFCSTNPFFSAFFYLPSIDFAFIFYFSFCSAVRGFAHYFRVFYENQIPIIHVMRKQNGTKFVLRTPQRGCHVRETHLNCHRCFGSFFTFSIMFSGELYVYCALAECHSECKAKRAICALCVQS